MLNYIDEGRWHFGVGPHRTSEGQPAARGRARRAAQQPIPRYRRYDRV